MVALKPACRYPVEASVYLYCASRAALYGMCGQLIRTCTSCFSITGGVLGRGLWMDPKVAEPLQFASKTAAYNIHHVLLLQ